MQKNMLSHNPYWDIIMSFKMSSCWLLWLPGWKNVIHEDVPGEVQETAEFSSGRGPQTEDRAASTIVSTTHAWWSYVFLPTNHPFTVFLFFLVQRVRSQSWVTQTPRHLNQCSSQQNPPARESTIQSHPCKWADQMTQALQVPERATAYVSQM